MLPGVDSGSNTVVLVMVVTRSNTVPTVMVVPSVVLVMVVPSGSIVLVMVVPFGSNNVTTAAEIGVRKPSHTRLSESVRFVVLGGPTGGVPTTHVFLSLEGTVPDGQVARQFPLSLKSPGRHWSHCGWADVAALMSKLGIEHSAHRSGHVSHTCFVLLTISDVPWHVPVLSTGKHCVP